ncbi:MAG: OpgC domain-containing protein, partial [Pseudomonadota bacterium]
FCSGYAAAIAFGGTFVRAGFWVGTARVIYRVWQIYAAHIAMFFFIAAIAVIATRVTDGFNYIARLNLNRFFSLTADAMVGMFTLTYVPNYFDILPMYIVALVLIPPLMLIAKFSPPFALATSVAIYVASWVYDFNLPAEPWSERGWFFNPFCWQLLFFTGYGLSIGWIKAPPARIDLIALALLIVVFALVTSYRPIWRGVEDLEAIRDVIGPYRRKTFFGPLRWIHILALAYLASVIFANRQHLLTTRWTAPIVKVGQQALPAFLFSMGASYVAGITLDQIGRNNGTIAAVNLTGLLMIIVLAYVTAWYKSEPWRSNRPAAQAA